MVRGPFIVGIVISLLLHALVLVLPGRPTPPRVSEPPPPLIVPVVETDLARVEPEPFPPMEPATEETATVTTPAPPEQNETAVPTPPSPPLERTADPTSNDAPPGGDVAGTRDGARATPGLRIDWGRPESALALIAAADMRIVVLDDTARITGAIVDTGATWRRVAYRPESTVRFSNRLRIVDDVPAFAAVRRAAALDGRERLAVLIPVAVDRRMQSAQLAAAYDRGLAPEDIRVFGGRFVDATGPRSQPGGVDFEVTHVDTVRPRGRAELQRESP